MHAAVPAVVRLGQLMGSHAHPLVALAITRWLG
jgi:hypothetical protein